MREPSLPSMLMFLMFLLILLISGGPKFPSCTLAISHGPGIFSKLWNMQQ